MAYLALARGMNRLRAHFFTGTTFAGNKNTGFAARRRVNGAVHRLHGLTATNKALIVLIFIINIVFEFRGFANRIIHSDPQSVRFTRLDQKSCAP